MSDNVKNTKHQNGVWGDVLTKEMVEKQAVLALEKDVCVLTGDIGVFRFKSIDPQAVEELPAVQMEMPKYKEESPEEVAFAIAPFNLWTTTGLINVLKELYQYGYVICRRVTEE